jgi:hypothetical protein
MATNQLAKGLASLGRNGDSMLMHVTPREVAGLSHLAKSMGGEITVNPHTGLPEAGFFDFLTNMLPTAVAANALAAPTGGTSLASCSCYGALLLPLLPLLPQVFSLVCKLLLFLVVWRQVLQLLALKAKIL